METSLSLLDKLVKIDLFLFLFSVYDVKVTTGNSFGAGTDANVYIKIIGTRESTTEHQLVGSGEAFEKGR